MTTIKLGEFLDRLHERLKKSSDSDALIFFEVFLQNNLIKKISEQEGALPNWQELDLVAGDYDDIYPFAVNMLHNAASSSSNSLSKHWDIFKVAHAVSIAFCQELNKVFEFTGDDERVFDLIPIKSYFEKAIETGIIEIEDGMVRLTPYGEEIGRKNSRR